ncbi:hypothetical protein N0V83_001367 [Neocucurbitaria cava]|uniref:Uncharacterized protein n=1 Tax=Neocucurbitaria cava TaxID=798079 RepID=A0A9W9CQD0_9PLEO|nr:hypothetical protein N0V83_001367 [Neocucurbitaria cava]
MANEYILGSGNDPLPYFLRTRAEQELLRRIQELESDNEVLQRVNEDIMKHKSGATKRAEARCKRIQQDLAREQYYRADDQMKSERVIDSHQSTIDQLREELQKAQASAADAQFQEYETHIAQLNAQNQVYKAENMRLQTELDHEKTLVKENIDNFKKKALESVERYKLEFQEKMQQQFDVALNQRVKEIMDKVNPLVESYKAEQQKTASLVKQLQAKAAELQWLKEHTQQSSIEQAAQRTPGKNVGQHGGIPLGAASTRRPLSSVDDVGITTPDAQRPQQPTPQPGAPGMGQE